METFLRMIDTLKSMIEGNGISEDEAILRLSKRARKDEAEIQNLKSILTQLIGMVQAGGFICTTKKDVYFAPGLKPHAPTYIHLQMLSNGADLTMKRLTIGELSRATALVICNDDKCRVDELNMAGTVDILFTPIQLPEAPQASTVCFRTEDYLVVSDGTGTGKVVRIPKTPL